jgi:hypothetical protein
MVDLDVAGIKVGLDVIDLGIEGVDVAFGSAVDLEVDDATDFEVDTALEVVGMKAGLGIDLDMEGMEAVFFMDLEAV